MSRHIANLGTLTIANGATQSNVLTVNQGFGMTVDMILYAANVAVTVYVGPDENMLIGDLIPLQVTPGVDFACAASRATVIPTSTFKSFAVVAGSAVSGDKVYKLRAQVDTV